MCCPPGKLIRNSVLRTLSGADHAGTSVQHVPKFQIPAQEEAGFSRDHTLFKHSNKASFNWGSGLAWNPGSQKPAEGQPHKQAFLKIAIKVQGLQGKKVIAIATGSLHCVCCSEDGRWKRFCNLEVCDLRGQGWIHGCKVVRGGYGGIHYCILKRRLWCWPLVLIPVNILCFVAEKSRAGLIWLFLFIFS